MLTPTLRLPLLRPSLTTATKPLLLTPPSRRTLARMTLIGRLAAEPEEIATASGKSLLKYAVGTSHGNRDNRSTSWFQVACFDEGVGRQILVGAGKGALIHVDAEGRMRTFEDAEGRKQSKIDLVQRSIEILSRPRNDNSSQAAATAAAGSEAGDEAV